MKKHAYFWIFLVVLLLPGCGDGAAPSAAVHAEAGSAGIQAEDGGFSAIQLEAEPRPLTEEEILSAYYRAEEAYGWFDLTPLPDNGESVRLEGTVYRRVDAPGMEDLDDLRTYLRSLFSLEMTERLLAMGESRPLYQDVDGALHVCFQGRNRDAGKGAAQVEVVQVDSQSYSLEVSVDLLDSGETTVIGLECWSIPYAYVDGRWVFTGFRLTG